MPLTKLAAAMSTIVLCKSSALGGGILGGGIPCGYEVAHVIQAPYCEPFGYPPTFGIGISPNGRYVCGFYNACVVGQPRAFVYDTTTLQFMTIPHPPGISSAQARDVTDAGMICGTAIKTGVGDQGFVYDLNTGLWTPLPSQNGAQGWSFANAINSSNFVCGRRSVDDGGDPVFPWSAYVWSHERGFIDLGLIDRETTAAVDINDLCFTTGIMASNGISVPLLWGNGTLFELETLAGMDTTPQALNNRNEIVGSSRVPNPKGSGFVSHAFLADVNGIIDLGVLPGYERSVANDINDDSVAVGFLRPPLDPPAWDHGFIWANGVMRDVNDLVKDSPVIVIGNCNAVGSQGYIVASGSTPSLDLLTIVLTPQQSSAGDVNGTCTVDVDDLLTVINEWGKTKSVADINQDQIVNYFDLLIVIENWTFS